MNKSINKQKQQKFNEEFLETCLKNWKSRKNTYKNELQFH